MSEGWTMIASYGSLMEAELAGGRLESVDIPFSLDQGAAAGAFGPGHTGSSIYGVGLKVPSRFAAAARTALDLDPVEE